MKLQLIVLLVCISVVTADVYMQNPRGSNDRLNEKNQNRQNANRIYDSQDNAAGGYAWGPPMKFYVGSTIEMQWTVQHGCQNPKVNCNFVIQYMCNNHVGGGMRDGTVTTTIPDDEQDSQDTKYGRQETYEYYQLCKQRQRNKGLFTADQNPGNSARSTRQNPNGNRHGFECPEERDYWPYWHPSPWRDVAVILDNTTMCEQLTSQSQNVVPKGLCSEAQYNNPTECSGNGGTWTETEAFGIPEPDCVETATTRVNHLGNGLAGVQNNYVFTVPDNVDDNCVLRLRYNISTGEYDGWNGGVDSSMNKGNSPTKTDPLSDYLGSNVSMALNTNQYGRTFQDRTFMFAIIARPDDVAGDAVIHNLNIRGKRGNIVQSYPAVEYDFVPNDLKVKEGEYVHFQWTGSDYNANNGNNNAEGTQGTDRNNLVMTNSLSVNTPDASNQTLFDEATAKRFAHQDQTDCLSYADLLTKHDGNQNNIDTDAQNCAKLNAASPYFDGGLIRMNTTGSHTYMSTRNNNFSNRSQKGSMTIEPAVQTWAIALIAVGAAVVGLGAVGAGIAAKKGLIFGGSSTAV